MARWRSAVTALGLAAVIVRVNAYVCRELFYSSTVHTNSMQGFWIAMAQKAGPSWSWPNWWPYWDCGMPFEFLYAPLVPGLTALLSWLRGIPADVAFQSVTAVVYCLGPVTLFVLAWRMTGSKACGFTAAMLYSLTAPTELFLPDSNYSLRHSWDARRLYLMGIWDETPHMTALAVLPIAILALWRAMEKRRPAHSAIAVAAIALGALASDFGPVLIVLSSVCLFFTFGRDRLRQNLAVLLAVGAYAYAIVCPFLSPTNLAAIQNSSGQNGHGWTISSFTALGIFVLGWAILWRWLPRWTGDRWLQFVSLFAYTMIAIPLLETYLHRHFVPQPNRYRMEAELALALLVATAGHALWRRLPRSVAVGFAMLLVGLAGEQVVAHRQFAKLALPTENPRRTIEYRASVWAENHLAGVRLMLPGSIAKWADAFTDVRQFSGGAWSTSFNPAQQAAVEGAENGGATPEEDARKLLLWLKAYGAGAIAVSGPKSTEVWKESHHPGKFEGVLPRVWSEDDVTIYTTGAGPLAHAVSEDAIVKRAPRGPLDTAEAAKYVAAIEAPRPPAEVRWTGRNRIDIALTAKPDEVVSIQVTRHAGWRARVNGAGRRVERDGLGLMWLRPNCAGACNIELNYDGGLELILCRTISYAALLGAPLALLFLRRRR